MAEVSLTSINSALTTIATQVENTNNSIDKDIQPALNTIAGDISKMLDVIKDMGDNAKETKSEISKLSKISETSSHTKNTDIDSATIKFRETLLKRLDSIVNSLPSGNGKGGKAISGKNAPSNIKDALASIKALSEIGLKTFIKAKIGAKLAPSILESLIELVKKYNKAIGKISKASLKKIKDFNEVAEGMVDSLKKFATGILLVGVLAIPAMMAATASIVFVKVLSILVPAMVSLYSSIDTDEKKVKEATKTLVMLPTGLLAFELLFLLTALLGGVVFTPKNLGHFFLSFGVATLFLLAYTLVAGVWNGSFGVGSLISLIPGPIGKLGKLGGTTKDSKDSPQAGVRALIAIPAALLLFDLLFLLVGQLGSVVFTPKNIGHFLLSFGVATVFLLIYTVVGGIWNGSVGPFDILRFLPGKTGKKFGKLAKLNKKGGGGASPKEGAKALIMIPGALLLFSLLFWGTALIAEKAFTAKNIGYFLASFGLATVTLAVFKQVSKKTEDIAKGALALAALGGGLLVFTLAMWGVSVVAKKIFPAFKGDRITDGDNLLETLGSFLSIGAIFALGYFGAKAICHIGKHYNIKDIGQGALALAATGASLLAFSLAMWGVTKVAKKVFPAFNGKRLTEGASLLDTLGSFLSIGAILALGYFGSKAIIAIGKNADPKEIGKGALALVAVGGVLLIDAFLVKKTIDLTKDITLKQALGSAALLAGFIGGAGLVILGVGALVSNPIIATMLVIGAVAIAGISTVLLAVSAMVAAATKATDGLDQAKSKLVAGTLVGFMSSVIDGLCDINALSIAEAQIKSLGLIPLVIVTSGIALAVGAIGQILNGKVPQYDNKGKVIGYEKVDLNATASAIVKMVSVLVNGIAELDAKYDLSKTVTVTSSFGFLSKSVQIPAFAVKLMALMPLGQFVSELATGITALGTKDSKGNPINYAQIGHGLTALVTALVDGIAELDAKYDLSKMVTITDHSHFFDEDIEVPAFAAKISSLVPLGGFVAQLADGITKLGTKDKNGNGINMKMVTSNLSIFIDSIVKIFNDDKMDALDDALDSIADLDMDGVDNLGKIIDSLTKTQNIKYNNVMKNLSLIWALKNTATQVGKSMKGDKGYAQCITEFVRWERILPKMSALKYDKSKGAPGLIKEISNSLNQFDKGNLKTFDSITTNLAQINRRGKLDDVAKAIAKAIEDVINAINNNTKAVNNSRTVPVPNSSTAAHGSHSGASPNKQQTQQAAQGNSGPKPGGGSGNGSNTRGNIISQAIIDALGKINKPLPVKTQ